FRASRILSLLILTGVVSACSEPAPPPKVDPLQKQLDIQTEVMHQTREVIRYIDEEERLKQALLNPPETDPKQSAPPPPETQEQSEN
ncbi:MAG: hypothetical protein OQL27_10570, partial [Sedimenticola sp.]|nr:hypothetical protein [Sedimenticola sp.]